MLEQTLEIAQQQGERGYCTQPKLTQSQYSQTGIEAICAYTSRNVFPSASTMKLP